MKYLYDLSFDELKEWCLSQGEPKFRAGQIFAALHNGTSLADIIGVPNALKEKISAEFETRLPSPEIIQKSKDGTVKYLLKLNDGKKIECVLLKQDYGNTLCVSSQVGCRMACAFCASGKNGLVRNLTCGEILAEVILINKLNMAEARDQHETDGSKKKGTIRAITNIVIMGSGEPFDNYDETIKFLRLVSAPEGINISARNISVSTSGIVPRIRDFANLKLQVNLCISLHAPNDEVRKKIMPVAHKYSVAELIDSAKYFVAQTNRRIIFEYSLIDGVNDSPEQAKELAKLVKGFQSHINLINLNPLPPELVREVNGFELKPPTKERAMQFMDAVIKNGASCTMRKNRGSDIDGACGQLSLKNS